MTPQTQLATPLSLHPDPVELLQRLIRFDTTNPPGNEEACVGYIRDLLVAAGCETTIVSRTSARPNLIARIPGGGTASPLLLYGHVDVVTTEGQQWSHPPFEGVNADGYIWGRGALDMKGGVAMMVTAFLRLLAGKVTPPGDVILLILSDEEAGGNDGARYLVENHPELLAGVRHAIGEFGGFTITIGGRRLYPIQIAEKQACWLRGTVRGPGGHGSLPMSGGAMAKLGDLLGRLDRAKLPIHVTPPARQMIGAIADAVGFPSGGVLRGLLNPALAGNVLRLLGDRGKLFEPLLRNSINATMVRGGEKINVIPSEIQVDFDVRLLPGVIPDQMIGELRKIVGAEVELEVLSYDPCPAEADMGMFELLAGILREADPEGRPIPYILPAVTDARFLSRLNIQTYGFLPMPLPDSMSFSQLIHAADERIPVDAVRFGADAIYRVLERFGTS
jgi:acetylornithine deacetylase/succinyl-diaminopimelate desuccinylase-like protein